MDIYIGRNDRRLGPYSVEQARQMLASGKLYPMDLAWYEGMDEWKPIFQVPEISHSPAPEAQAPAPRLPEKGIQKPNAYEESRIKGITKRAIGGLFILFGLGLLYAFKLVSSPVEKGIFVLQALFFLIGGVWWALGKGEQCLVPLKARLSLIFALLLVGFLPNSYGPVLHTFGPHAALIVIGVIFAVLGVPTLVLGHLARAQIRRDPAFRGKGRVLTSLCLAYSLLLIAGLMGLSGFETPAESAAPSVEASTQVAPGAGSIDEQRAAVEKQKSVTDDILGTVWKAQEYGEWKGQWIRRGYSTIFDVSLKDGERGGTKTFQAFVTRKGNKVHIQSKNSSDKRDSVYDGEISPDGTTVAGTYTCAGGGPYCWSASIAPLVRAKAPEGMFYTTQHQTFFTDDGVVGFPPATKVEQIEDRGETLFVRSGQSRFEVSKDILTDDLYLAASILIADRNAQASLAKKSREQLEAVEAVKRQEWEKLEAERLRNVAASRSSAPSHAFNSSPLQRGSYAQSGGKNSRLPNINLTKEQSEALVNYYLDNAKPDHSAPLRSPRETIDPPSKEAAELRKIKDAQRAIIDSQIRELEKTGGTNDAEIRSLRQKRDALGYL